MADRPAPVLPAGRLVFLAWFGIAASNELDTHCSEVTCIDIGGHGLTDWTFADDVVGLGCRSGIEDLRNCLWASGLYRGLASTVTLLSATSGSLHRPISSLHALMTLHCL